MAPLSIKVNGSQLESTKIKTQINETNSINYCLHILHSLVLCSGTSTCPYV